MYCFIYIIPQKNLNAFDIGIIVQFSKWSSFLLNQFGLKYGFWPFLDAYYEVKILIVVFKPRVLIAQSTNFWGKSKSLEVWLTKKIGKIQFFF